MNRSIIVAGIFSMLPLSLISIEDRNVKGPYLQFSDKSKFDLQEYSAIVYEIKNKKIREPIFKGSGNVIEYRDLKKIVNKHEWSSYCYDIKFGHLKKTFLELINFYKQSYLKNIDTDHPTYLETESKESYAIWYDFEYENIPCSVLILVGHPPKKIDDKDLKSIQTLKFDEKKDGFISVDFRLGEHSPFYKKK